MNQFSNNSQINWKPNSLHSSRPANQHGQPSFLLKMLMSQTSLARNAKEVTYSQHALNTRNVRQTKGMTL